jgi:hypothetical protein
MATFLTGREDRNSAASSSVDAVVTGNSWFQAGKRGHPHEEYYFSTASARAIDQYFQSAIMLDVVHVIHTLFPTLLVQLLARF